jgi:hypothetical protein
MISRRGPKYVDRHSESEMRREQSIMITHCSPERCTVISAYIPTNQQGTRSGRPSGQKPHYASLGVIELCSQLLIKASSRQLVLWKV